MTHREREKEKGGKNSTRAHMRERERGGEHKGDENRLKIARERSAVGTFERTARLAGRPRVVDRSHRVSSSGC